MVVVVVVALVAPSSARADEATFAADVAALTQAPHRLSGTPEAAAAGDHILQRLKAVGVDEVHTLEMPVWQTYVDRCEVSVGGQSAPLLPVRPNIIVPPVTPPGGLTAPWIYVGKGTPGEYGDRSPDGKIVALDFDCGDEWHRAFTLGAAAVVFLGADEQVAHAPKHVGVPANFVRLYAPPATVAALDLKRDHESVTVASDVDWRLSRGRNIIGIVKGRNPTFVPSRDKPEALVLAANYDSFGVVPHLSPNARGAANVAALLDIAGKLVAQRPQRDVILLLLDNEARLNQGARQFYDTLSAKTPAALEEFAAAHRTEQAYVRAMLESLVDGEGIRAGVDAAAYESAHAFLFQQAYFIHSDLSQEIVRYRMAGDEDRARKLDHRKLEWDNLRRILHNRTLPDAVTLLRDIDAAADALDTGTRAALRQRLRDGGFRNAFDMLGDDEAPAAAVRGEAREYLGLVAELTAVGAARLRDRLAELDDLIELDTQQIALKQRLNDYWIVLHVDLNFSDGGPAWGVVVGDRMDKLFPFRATGNSSDSPGYYGPILAAIRAAAEAALPADNALAETTLVEPNQSVRFAPGVYNTSGSVAGTYAIYHTSWMTGYDARPRDGQPGDTPDTLNLSRLYAFTAEAATLAGALGDSAALSQPRRFTDQSFTKRTGWNNNRSTGDYVALRVTGSLSEDRPAYHSVLALFPNAAANKPWVSLQHANLDASFDPMALEVVDMNGRFSTLGVQKEIFGNSIALGARFDDVGRVSAISTQKSMVRGKLTDAARVEVFPAVGYAMAATVGQRALPEQFQVLRAASDSPVPDTRRLIGQLGPFGFFYMARQDLNAGVDAVKIFQPFGPVWVNPEPGEPYGVGVPLEKLDWNPPLAVHTAHDLWTINEARLATLRQRGVTQEDLERLHGRAGRNLEEATAPEVADGPSTADRKAKLIQSAALSRAVYSPLRAAMDDLVHAIVVLLLLAIPFAFALERLLVGATSIYGRLAGFTVAFLVTFALLYVMHPGFAIASTPIIIFLAFAILLLSSLVIYIIARKFRTELRAMQGQAGGLHDVEVSKMGTLLAAVGMGMSTMRRRPTRTFLTAITVVMLTFTILSFASFSRKIGVRSVYQGPAGDETSGDVLVRKLDYSALPESDLELVRGLEGEGGAVFGQYWMVRKKSTDDPYSVARADNARAQSVDAIMGIDPAELPRWPLLRDALAGEADADTVKANLEKGGVYLPRIVIELLDLEVGDGLLVNGRPAFVAGGFDSTALQKLRHLDGESVLPVDFQDPSAQQQTQAAPANDQTALLQDAVDKDFVHLGADQVVVASAEFVRRQNGNLHSMVVYFGRGVDGASRGEDVARIAQMPLWARTEQGVERMILTTLTEVSGGMALAVPVLLGGLIIFGTLLGSISDREKEIYTFSALGLAPAHVGVLFFAEAAVYAVVGGMGGQLLAQVVAQVTSFLAERGVIDPPAINYSSSNSLFAIGIVMATVLISAVYPALRASKSANPGLARAWKMPPPNGDDLAMTFPFTVSAYDITGVVSFLAEHFQRHDDAGLGSFAAQHVKLGRTADRNLYMAAEVALAPFDLGVTQTFKLTAKPSEIAGVDEVAIEATRLSGAKGDWLRANRVFLRDLRRQFLLWRTLSAEMIEGYRGATLSRLGNNGTAVEVSVTQDNHRVAEEAEVLT